MRIPKLFIVNNLEMVYNIAKTTIDFKSKEKNAFILQKFADLIKDNFSGLTLAVIDLDEKREIYQIYVNLNKTGIFMVLSVVVHELLHWLVYQLVSDRKHRELEWKFNRMVDKFSEGSGRII